MDETEVSGADEQRSLVVELAQLVIEQAAPEELVLFQETSTEYFADPDGVVDPRRRDEPLGFGLDLAMVTPYVLAMVTSCLAFLARSVAETAASEAAKPAIGDLLKRFLRPRHPGPDAEVSALTRDQAESVRQVALGRAKDLGLSEQQSRLLADAVLGGLNVAR